MKVKGDGSCLYHSVASHIMSCCLDDVWTVRFHPGKKPGIKLVTYEVVSDLEQFISQKESALLQIFLAYLPFMKLMILSKKR